ncbi:MAG: MFS transporter [Planctomycetota bacterium]
MTQPATDTAAAGTTPPGRAWMSRTVLVLGAASLLTDVATEMIVPLMPLFIGMLGGGAIALGLLEGLAEATASTLKLFAGRWSDRLDRRRPFVVVGYSLASAVRPLVALTTAVWQVVAIRMLDRVGKGLRTSPRDALIARSVPADQKARAFSLHRAMDHTGAVIGALLAALAVWLLTDASDPQAAVRTVFWLTIIPGALAISVVTFGVRELDAPAPKKAPEPTHAHAGGTAKPYRLSAFLLPLALFTLGNASDIFLLMKAVEVQAPAYTLPLLWAALHVVKTAASVPGGWVADRLGHRRTIGAGWLFYAGVYVAFAFVTTPMAVLVLCLLYGIYHGLTEGPEKALVAGLAPADKQGTAFGWYHFTLGMLSLAASVIFGVLWEVNHNADVAFLTSAALAVLATVSLWWLGRGSDRNP